MTPGQSRERRAARTRARILEAAGARFSELGFAATRLEDVGEEVGIGRSAILYHYRDKRLLYRAVLDAVFGELLDALRAPLLGSGPLGERLEAAVRAFVRFVARRPIAARLALRECVDPDPETRAEIQGVTRPFLALLAATFEEGARSGAFRPGHPEPLQFASAVAGATLFYVAALPTVVGELPYDPLSREALAAHERVVLEITRRLLGTRGPRAVERRPGPPEGRTR
jgi:TetR/AcrR family transcriptional regulator